MYLDSILLKRLNITYESTEAKEKMGLPKSIMCVEGFCSHGMYIIGFIWILSWFGRILL
jgi:hypothetical protein